MARKIKRKQAPTKNNSGIIIISIACGLVAVMIVLLLILFISGKACSGQDQKEFPTGSTVSTAKAIDVTYDQSHEDDSYYDSVIIDENMDYLADITVREYGTITVRLDYQAAPITTKNFIYLARSGFYNGLTFHRIIEGFMMQGGDPQGNGRGGSEHTIYGEFSENGFNNPLSHTKGAISMARGGYDMNSASSQFFIVQSDNKTASLDGKYACFGYVTEGIELVDAICLDAKPTDNNGTIPADQQPVIDSVVIHTEPKTF